MTNETTILIVDDIDTNIQILNTFLEDKYEIMAALDGEFAIEIANDDMPDLILLDVKMPGMDGYEVCQKLKKDHKTKNIPIIFITADRTKESIEKAYAVGGIDFISKPIIAIELFTKIQIQLTLQKCLASKKSENL